MKKLFVLLLTLVLGVTAFGMDAKLGIVDLDALLQNYNGFKDAGTLVTNKTNELLAPYNGIGNLFGLSPSDLKLYRSLKEKKAPSTAQSNQIAALETASAANIAKLNQCFVTLRTRELNEEEDAFYITYSDYYKANQEALEKEITDAQNKVTYYTRNLENIIQVELDKAIEQVAKEQKLNMVIKNSVTSGEKLILWSDKSGDITVAVQNLMNKNYDKAIFDKATTDAPVAK